MSKPILLILSVYFPPKNHIASRRIQAFAEYLADDFEITVVTHTENNRYEEVEKKYKVIYLSNGFLDNILILNDGDFYPKRILKLVFRKLLTKLNIIFFSIWKKNAEKKIVELISEIQPNFILSSYMPIEAHDVVFNVLSSDKKYKDIFWIADMRDEMSEHISNNDRQRRILEKKEELYGERIDLITSVSLPILNQFKKNMKNVENFLEIRNGFNHNINIKYCKKDKLKIGYFGTFYGDIKPDNFFLALLNFEFIDDLEIHIASSSHNYLIPDRLKNNVKKMDFLTYEESIQVMSGMDCNLLILPFMDTRQGVYSGKLFDYLSTTRPILALVNQNDVAANLIKEFDCGYFADPNSIDNILSSIYSIYDDWKKSKLKMANRELISKLHRKSQVDILRNFLLSNTEDR